MVRFGKVVVNTSRWLRSNSKRRTTRSRTRKIKSQARSNWRDFECRWRWYRKSKVNSIWVTLNSHIWIFILINFGSGILYSMKATTRWNTTVKFSTSYYFTLFPFLLHFFFIDSFYNSEKNAKSKKEKTEKCVHMDISSSCLVQN